MCSRCLFHAHLPVSMRWPCPFVLRDRFLKWCIYLKTGTVMENVDHFILVLPGLDAHLNLFARDSRQGGDILLHSKYCSLKMSVRWMRGPLLPPCGTWTGLSSLHRYEQAQNCNERSTSPTYLSTSYLEILTKRISLTSLKLEKHYFTYKM